MARDRGPVFLERSSYRRRRMMDALRLVVVLGVILWMIPVIWPDGRDQQVQGVSTSHALFYVFGVWGVLIALAALLARLLQQAGGGDPAEEDTAAGKSESGP